MHDCDMFFWWFYCSPINVPLQNIWHAGNFSVQWMRQCTKNPPTLISFQPERMEQIFSVAKLLLQIKSLGFSALR